MVAADAPELNVAEDIDMPVPPQDRPLNSVREETIDRLIVNYGHGKLSLEAFERRLDQALDAKSADALVALTSDLELQVDRQYAQQKRAEFGIRTEPVPYARDTSWMIHIFGGGNRRGTWTVPSEIWMVNIFGGAEIDFSEARLTSPVTPDQDAHALRRRAVLRQREHQHAGARRSACSADSTTAGRRTRTRACRP